LAVFAVAAVCTGARAQDFVTPRQAIERAADAAPAGVDGTFTLQVRAVGVQDGILYLNSERDYRDQRNLSIDIPPSVAAALLAKYGSPPMTFLMGKHIAVTGQARRVTIWFQCDGKATDKYYYQTHVELHDASQIEILPES
jgi:hypothetical protein